MTRQQLGTLVLGNHIAIPRCRLAPCENLIGAWITLKPPVDFDSLDGKPVDILILLLVPHEEHHEHVRTLAELADLFNDEDFCYTIRHTLDSEDLYNIAITD